MVKNIVLKNRVKKFRVNKNYVCVRLEGQRL